MFSKKTPDMYTCMYKYMCIILQNLYTVHTQDGQICENWKIKTISKKMSGY